MSVQPMPNADQWVGLHYDVPFGSFVVSLPIEVAEEYAEKLPAMIAEAVKQIKLAKGGLVVAGEETLHVLKGKK